MPAVRPVIIASSTWRMPNARSLLASSSPVIREGLIATNSSSRSARGCGKNDAERARVQVIGGPNPNGRRTNLEALNGRLLWLLDDDPELFSISTFVAHIWGPIWLARRLDPMDGTPLAASHLVNIEVLSAVGECEIF